MPESSFEFTRAITRLPAKNIVNGLHAKDVGEPDYQQMLLDHADYVATLQQAGATVTELPALEAFADSVFVEDVALCLPEIAILMRPGAESRAGEVAHMAPVLNKFYEQVEEISGPGHIEGGDILTTAKEILVGRSALRQATRFTKSITANVPGSTVACPVFRYGFSAQPDSHYSGNVTLN